MLQCHTAMVQKKNAAKERKQWGGCLADGSEGRLRKETLENECQSGVKEQATQASGEFQENRIGNAKAPKNGNALHVFEKQLGGHCEVSKGGRSGRHPVVKLHKGLEATGERDFEGLCPKSCGKPPSKVFEEGSIMI